MKQYNLFHPVLAKRVNSDSCFKVQDALDMTTRALYYPGTKSLEGIRDQLAIVKIIRENDKIGFLYLSHAVPKNSVDYHYYNLKVGYR